MVDKKSHDFTQLKGIYQSVPLDIKYKATDDFAQFVEDRYYRMSYAKQPIRQVWQGHVHKYLQQNRFTRNEDRLDHQ